MLNWGNIGELVERHGAREICGKLIEAAKLPKTDKEHLDIEEGFSIRDCWEAAVGPVSRTIAGKRTFRIMESRSGDAFREAADGVAAFSTLTGQVIRARLIRAYENPAFIGTRLVRSEQEKHRDVKVGGLEGAASPEEITPGMPYPRKGIGREIYATAEQIKKGLILEIDEDLITEDQTGQILGWARRVGRRMGINKEKRILNGIQDTASQVFRPQGAAEAIYRTAVGTNSKRITKSAAKALTDWTDIDEALQILAAIKENRDQTGEYVGLPARLNLVVPMALRQTALRIVNATRIGYGNFAAASPHTISPQDPIIQNLGTFWSPYLDAQSVDTWYLGDTEEEFVWVYKWLLRVEERVRELESWWNRDVLMEVKAGEYGELMAEDDAYVVQCPGS